MKITPLDINGLFLIEAKKFSDDRGYFSELYRQDQLNAAAGRKIDFVQDNFSLSKKRGTIRGLHYQSSPYAQGKLVRCSRGELLDVVVDARKGSPTYGKHYKVKLSFENNLQLWVPEGFLHGFVTLTDNCEITYKVTNFYSAESDGSVRWNDPDLCIDWGIDSDDIFISEKDKHAPLFKNFTSPFSYE